MSNMHLLKELEAQIPDSQLSDSLLATLSVLCHDYTRRSKNSILCQHKELIQPCFSWMVLIQRKRANNDGERQEIWNYVMKEQDFTFTRFKRSILFTAQLLIQRSTCLEDPTSSWIIRYQTHFFYPWSAIYKVEDSILCEYGKMMQWLDKAYKHWQQYHRPISTEIWLDYCLPRHRYKPHNKTMVQDHVEELDATLLLNIACVNH